MKGQKLRRVFVWELPVRIFHWINALAVLVLCVTGYLIGNPPALMSGAEASFQYTFGTIRYLHFIAAYLFIFNFLFRLYWGFVGNKYANWKNFIPTNRNYFKEVWNVFRIDILLKPRTEHLSVGHNALAGFMYFIIFLFSAFMILTGFGLYANMSTWWLAKMFNWVSPLFGSDFDLRNWHHAAMWVFIVFTIIHVYLVLYHDYVEGRGEMSSMFGGWKFIEEGVFQGDQHEAVEREQETPKRA